MSTFENQKFTYLEGISKFEPGLKVRILQIDDEDRLSIRPVGIKNTGVSIDYTRFKRAEYMRAGEESYIILYYTPKNQSGDEREIKLRPVSQNQVWVGAWIDSLNKCAYTPKKLTPPSSSSSAPVQAPLTPKPLPPAVENFVNRTLYGATGRSFRYVVLQVVLKEAFLGTGSGNLRELEDVINKQAEKGYRLHTISTTNGGSKGFMGGDRIQATMVFEKIE